MFKPFLFLFALSLSVGAVANATSLRPLSLEEAKDVVLASEEYQEQLELNPHLEKSDNVAVSSENAGQEIKVRISFKNIPGSGPCAIVAMVFKRSGAITSIDTFCAQ